jgi:nitrite reductase/ring-hydroxylating ferredoxin subunit
MSAAPAGPAGAAGTAGPDGFAPLAGVRAAELANGQLRTGTLPNGTRLCVGRHRDALFAVKDECTHAEFPLSEGSLYANGELECCWHGARFDCRTGAVLRGPAEEPLVRYEVEEREGVLWVRRTRAGTPR